MASDSKFDYLSQVRQALMVVMQPLQVIANTPFKLYDNISSYFVLQQSLRQELDTLKKQTLVYGVQLQAFASLKSENENLRTLLDASKVSIHPTNLAEIVYTGRDPFTQKVHRRSGGYKKCIAWSGCG